MHTQYIIPSIQAISCFKASLKLKKQLECRLAVPYRGRLKMDKVTKKFSVVLPDSIFNKLQEYADQQGRSVANLAAYFIESGIDKAEEKGDYTPKKKGKEE
jgi:CopG-like RHH_1 or ribbon-helix-helix domain, RHH_5